MDWEQLGFQVGQAAALSWGKNYYDRGVDKARDKIQALSDPTEEDRRNAMAQAEARFGSGLIGQNPQTQLLQAKRDWMQADNDAQYLLNHGYTEDSPDVQAFRKIQAGAHENAEGLRSLGKSMGLDLSKVGAGLSLQELKDAVNRGIAPKLYQQQPDLQEQMAARHAWAGQTARDILGDQTAQGAQRVGVAPASATNPQSAIGAAPMTPPTAQIGGYTQQHGANLIGFDPNAGFGMAGTANPTQPDDGFNSRAITSGDIYKFLQDQGYIPRETSYEEVIEEIAKEYAKQRAAKMDEKDVKKYLLDHGVRRDIAKLVVDEHTQKMQRAAKKEALAQAAESSTSPQMAALIAAAAADPNTKLSDITGLINATNPDMKFETIDLGGTKVAMTRDVKGRVRGGAQVLPMTLSPKDAVGLQFNYDKLGSEVDRFNAQENRLWKTALGNWQNRLDVARTNGDYGLVRASMRGGGKGSGGDGKISAADEKIASQFGNQFNNVMEFYNMDGDVSREEMGDAVDQFYNSVMEGIDNGTIKSEDADKARNQAYLAQLLYATKFGEKEDARRIWSSFDNDWLYDTDNPDYMTLNNIYQWLSAQDAGEKAHVQNTMPTQKEKYEPVQAYNWLKPN